MGLGYTFSNGWSGMKRNGFSLIELIIVISILGILSLLTIPRYSQIQIKAKEVSLKSLMYSLQTAIETYHLSNGQYPEGSSVTALELVDVLADSGEWNQVPQNPFTGTVYVLENASGKILYSQKGDQYTLQGYGYQNKEIIIELESI
ncbi:MAG: prepilin-type N-terminal cleavage/methylation domain-containing protein [Candidatus Margulisbacteria bacterium]|nr:prepilin-type N-terminal cleavage/methylation domain-containing protein [Candidatus Margulisiibacteriota bacterium]